MKISKISGFTSWLQDLKQGRLINHQPARKKGYAKWYKEEVEREGRKLS